MFPIFNKIGQKKAIVYYVLKIEIHVLLKTRQMYKKYTFKLYVKAFFMNKLSVKFYRHFCK